MRPARRRPLVPHDDAADRPARRPTGVRRRRRPRLLAAVLVLLGGALAGSTLGGTPAHAAGCLVPFLSPGTYFARDAEPTVLVMNVRCSGFTTEIEVAVACGTQACWYPWIAVTPTGSGIVPRATGRLRTWLATTDVSLIGNGGTVALFMTDDIGHDGVADRYSQGSMTLVTGCC